MWHVHNEYACHVPYCYCEPHAESFRAWLKTRYGPIEALNEAWGTAFWSQRYGDFAEVVPPRMTPTFVNPSQELDYRRFSSDAFLDEFLEERADLKGARPEIPLTTNFMGFFKPLDYFEWASDLDVVSTDNYTDPADPDAPMLSAMHYDLVRSLNKNVPWLVMEQTSLRVNWRPHNSAKAPGQMRALSYQAVARGAAGVLFFQWRASRSEAEKFHSAMLPHSGVASTVWAEVVALGGELARLAPLEGSSVQAPVAVAFSWANWWALEAPSKPANDLTMADQLAWMYGPPLPGRGHCGLLPAGRASRALQSGARTQPVPLEPQREGANLVSYVEAGGTAVISFWSGVVDEHDSVYVGPYGGPFRALIGCHVVDVAPLPAAETLELEWEDGSRSTGTFWADITTESDGCVLARRRRAARGPAGRRLSRPAGERAGPITWPPGSTPSASTGFTASTLALLGEQAVVRAGPGVERVVRVSAGHSYEFLINHSAEQARWRWPRTALTFCRRTASATG